MRKMGGLFNKMKITAITCWIGSLALIGTPFFSGYYSKDYIIDAVRESHRFGAQYAYYCVLIGVFVTAFYSFRLLFMTFHGAPRWSSQAHHSHDEHGHDGHHGGEPHESPAVVTVPLVLLAIPSVLIGAMTVGPLLFGGAFGNSIFVREANDVVAELGHEFHGWLAFGLHAVQNPVFYLAAAGVGLAWFLYIRSPATADRLAQVFAIPRWVLERKYGFDWFNENVLAAGGRLLGTGLWKGGDQAIIDRGLVDGAAGIVDTLAGMARRVQTGYLYSYAFWMVIGLALLLGWFVLKV